MTLELLPMELAVCKLPEDARPDPSIPFSFFARTDQEASLVCPSECAPENALKKEAGWRCLRVRGPLDFSLVGVLARLSSVLAARSIPIFAVSTYDTDYLLIKKEALPAALNALREAEIDVR